jgi:processive 1,2-diacylglycerol beta-glucosyltransferase
MKKSILILTGSYGSGHNVAAHTMAKYYEAHGYRVRVIDIVDFLENIIGKGTQKYYQDFCHQYPISWKITYDILDNPIIKKILFGFKYPVFQKKFDAIIEDFHPDVVLSFFPSWGGFIKKHIKTYGKHFRTGIMITDAISMHSVWYLDSKYIDRYFVLDRFSKEVFFKKFSHKKDNVVVSFFPIEEQYFLKKETIEAKNIYILLTSLSENFVTELIGSLKKEAVILHIIKGRNELLFDTLQNASYKSDKVKYYTSLDLKQNYQHIDIFIGKAGGATISECIATDTPIIVPEIIPGQESGNVELLLKTETGIFEANPQKIAFYIKYLDWNKFLPNFEKLKNKKSCEIIFNEMKI